jgi:hypothetical protein
MPTDLTATAAGNSPARRTAAAKLVADGSGELASFKAFAAESAFSTNVVIEKIVAYAQTDGIVDTRAYCVLWAAGDRAAGLTRFKSLQGDKFDRRQAFEDLWRHGRSFLYGAVNGGGLGVEDFGPICLVLADVGAQTPVALGVFPEDSVGRYTSVRGTVDIERATSEATAWSDRAELAVLERAGAVAGAPPASWPPLLCSNDDYLEVALAGRLALTALAEARMSGELRELLDELWARRWLLDEQLTDLELVELNAYEILQTWRRRHGVALESVPS